MYYKEELQQKNEEKLQKKFDKEKIPYFIQKYFVNIESRAGRINYWNAIRDLFLWLMEKDIIHKHNLNEITPEDFFDVESEDITMYLHYKEKNGMSPTTLETRKNIFRSFWKYLVRSNKCPVTQNIIESVSYKGFSSNNNLTKKLPSEEQIVAMEKRILSKNDSFFKVRNFTILRLLKGSGIRESELVGLNFEDLFLDEDIPYIKILGKGKYRQIEARDVLLTNDSKIALEEWLAVRQNIDQCINQAVFVTKTGKRMLESEVEKMFKKASGGTITPHMMRHYYATVAAKAGGVVFAQQQLGHSTMNTTINNYANGSYGMKDILARL